MPRGVSNKRHMAEFKREVIETMLREHLSHAETAERFEYGISGYRIGSTY